MFTINVHQMDMNGSFERVESGQVQPEVAFDAYFRLVGHEYGPFGVTVCLEEQTRLALTSHTYERIEGLEEVTRWPTGVLFIYTFSDDSRSRTFTVMHAHASELMAQHESPVMHERVRAELYGELS